MKQGTYNGEAATEPGSVYNSSLPAGIVRNQLLVLSSSKAQVNNNYLFSDPQSSPFLHQHFRLANKSYCGSHWLSCKVDFFFLSVFLFYSCFPPSLIKYQNLEGSNLLFSCKYLWNGLIETVANSLPGNIWKTQSQVLIQILWYSGRRQHSNGGTLRLHCCCCSV